MASDVSNVTTGVRRVDGGIYAAPLGTTLPTDASSQLDTAFKNVGYLSEDGMTNSISKSSTEIKEWGGDVVLAVQTGQTDKFKFKFIESLNVDTLKAVFGASNVTETNGALTVKVNATDTGEKSYVIDMVQSDGRLKRIVIPRGKITELGDIVYKLNEAVAYDVTLTASLDSQKNTHYEYVSAASAAQGSGNS